MKKWLTPIALLVLSAVLLVSVYVIVLAICGSNDGYAGAVYALWGIIIAVLSFSRRYALLTPGGC